MLGRADETLKIKENFVKPECEWGYRLLGVSLVFLCVFLVSLVSITIRDNVIKVQFDSMMQSIYNFSAKHGLYIEDVIIEGNVRTSYEDLMQALNLGENESILGVDINQLQKKVEQLTWVRECVVKRSFFPHNILVNIKEREVKAIWQYEGRYYPVDNDGNVIEVEEYEPDAPLLVLVGEGAPHHLKELLDVLNTDKELANRVKAGVYVSNRRWNLIFDNIENGITVKLPEKNFDKAYQKIALLNKRQGIFKRKLTSFDLRYENRIIVDIDKSVENLIIKE